MKATTLVLEGVAHEQIVRASRAKKADLIVIGLRRRIAQKMAESTRRVAHFSYVEEVDVTALEDLRERAAVLVEAKI